MSDAPAWLPPLVRLADYGGDWERYLAALYAGFREDFVESQPSYPHKRWSLKRMPMYDGKEATFWHIISEGQHEDERIPDLRRCERIRWPRAIIDAIGTDQVRAWQNRRGTEQRVVLTLPDFSYIVVLADRGEYIMLWTAYNVMFEHQRRKQQKEYQAYLQSLKS